MLICAGASASAQNVRERQLADPEKTVGVYNLYPETLQRATKPPRGYKPFYISHYGRHGSRYMSKETDYTETLGILEQAAMAGALTELGQDVYERAKVMCAEARDRSGELSPKGVLQHRGIAERMYMNYPELFKGRAEVHSQSTQVLRCVLSMAAFNERLKEMNPKLQTHRESGVRPTRVLNFLTGVPDNGVDPEYKEYLKNGAWAAEVKAFEDGHISTERFMEAVFSDMEYASEVDARKLMNGLLGYARSVRNTEAGFTFDDVFTAEELYLGSVADNYVLYSKFGPSPMNAGHPRYLAALLLDEIIKKADAAVAGEGPAADLRFGHDGNLMALLNIMEIEGCTASCDNPADAAEQWPVYQITPMAANLQMVFFRKGDDVIVKFLHNERETKIPVKSIDGVYYRWQDVRDFYMDILDNMEKPKL